MKSKHQKFEIQTVHRGEINMAEYNPRLIDPENEKKYTTMTMTCSTCNQEKPAESFSKTNLNIEKNRGMCKECKHAHDKKYREKYREKIAKQQAEDWRNNPERRKRNKRIKELRRTGIDATAFVENKCCEHCGIGNDEHIKKYKQRLHIHHRNNKGRRAINKGDRPDHSDIIILCVACHASSEEHEKRDYAPIMKKAWKTRYEKYGEKGYGKNKESKV